MNPIRLPAGVSPPVGALPIPHRAEAAPPAGVQTIQHPVGAFLPAGIQRIQLRARTLHAPTQHLDRQKPLEGDPSACHHVVRHLQSLRPDQVDHHAPPPRGYLLHVETKELSFINCICTNGYPPPSILYGCIEKTGADYSAPNFSDHFNF